MTPSARVPCAGRQLAAALDLGTPKQSNHRLAQGGEQAGQSTAGPPAHSPREGRVQTAQPAPFRGRGERPPQPKALAPGCVTLCPTVWEALGAVQLHRRGTGHCSQRFAHAGKALYLDWREDFKGQESRTKREQLDKGQSETVTLQKKHKSPCYSQKTKKGGEEKKKGAIQKDTHCYNRNIWFATWGNHILRGEKTGSPHGRHNSLPGQVPGMHCRQVSCSRATLMQQQCFPVCFWLNV